MAPILCTSLRAQRVSPDLSESQTSVEAIRSVERIESDSTSAENIGDPERGLWPRADRPPGLYECPEVPTE